MALSEAAKYSLCFDDEAAGARRRLVGGLRPLRVSGAGEGELADMAATQLAFEASARFHRAAPRLRARARRRFRPRHGICKGAPTPPAHAAPVPGAAHPRGASRLVRGWEAEW
jgi:hypothetical protein